MKLERISAIVHPGSHARSESRLPARGESLLLTYTEPVGTELLATMSNGVSLRLAGLERWRDDLLPGDTLRVRVLASQPTLELELEGTPARAVAPNVDGADTADIGHASTSPHAAMRLDQAALRQMSWALPNSAALAMSWREMALERWKGGIADDATADTPSTPPTLLGQAPFREPASTVHAPSLDRWLFPVYAWGGAQILLGLYENDEHDPTGLMPRKKVSARLALTSATLGRLVVCAQWMPGGVHVSIAVEDIASVPLVRDSLPRIRAALTRVGLRLVRFQLTQGRGALSASGALPTPAAHASFISQSSSVVLFHTLAEAALVLLQIVPAPA